MENGKKVRGRRTKAEKKTNRENLDPQSKNSIYYIAVDC